MVLFVGGELSDMVGISGLVMVLPIGGGSLFVMVYLGRIG